MLARTTPAFLCGVIFAIAAGGGVAVATQDDTADRRSYASKKAATKSYDAMGVEIDLDGNGFTDVIGAYASCPRGTQMTGGGFYDLTYSGITGISVPDPDGEEGWLVAVFVDENEFEDPDNVAASVVCWYAKGTPRGGYRAVPETAADLPESALEAIREAAAKRDAR